MVSIRSLFARAQPALLGIDVSSSSVKLVELQQSRRGGLVLAHCGMEPFEPGWISEGQVERFDEVAEALRRLVRRCGSRTRQAVLALPGAAVITRRIMLPAGLGDDEMALQVESEASQYIPFPLGEVSLDFCVIGPAAGSAGHVDVLLAASRRERVSDRQALAEAAGLTPVIMDVESHALRRAASRVIDTLPNQGRDALIALFEIGSHSTSVQVMRNDEVIYERDQMFGGAVLTQQIARQYGLAFEEAEARKRLGDLPPGYDAQVLRPFMEGLGQEVGRALQFFFTSTPHNKVDQVLLSGGCAALPGLVEAVAAQTAFACKVVNPFDGMTLAPSVRASALATASTSYLVATGLALRSFHP